jgi:putative phosphoesterase
MWMALPAFIGGSMPRKSETGDTRRTSVSSREAHMRVGIISDIHGNLQALDVVLEDIGRRGLDAVYCLGDLVGYAPFPNEVIERIRAAEMPTIMGNYDDGVGYDRDECGCAYRDPVERELGDQSFNWTKVHVTSDKKAFLRTLLPELRVEADGKRLLLVHGSPRKMNEYLFEDRPLSSFQRIADASNADVIVFGHTHRPYTKGVGDVLFVNAGSVGKPKDGDWRACYAILELGAQEPVQFVRLEYDVASVAGAIRASELPNEFAEDIRTGGDPGGGCEIGVGRGERDEATA